MKPRHFDAARFHLADWFTLGNAFCGTGAIFAAMRYLQDGVVRDLLLGMALIPVAFVFDAMDGRIARWRKVASTFGARIGFIGRCHQLRRGTCRTGLRLRSAGWLGLVDPQLFRRLRGQPAGTLQRHRRAIVGRRGKVKYFEEHAHSTSVLLVACLAWSAWAGALGHAILLGVVRLRPWQLHPLVLLYALSGSLMISKTLHIPKL